MNQLVIARMISGPGERKAASTANETFQSVLAASGHASEDSELRRVLLSQKCKATSFASITRFLKKQNEYAFPTNERGHPLRDCIAKLCGELTTDFEPAPEDMARYRLVLQSLISASGCSSMALNIFQQYVIRTDDEVENFETECAEGSVHGKRTIKGDPTGLPGFARLTGDDSDVEWTRVCSAVLDRMCFVDAKDLDMMYEKQLGAWKSRQYGRKLSKDELDMQEQAVFEKMEDAAAAVDTDAPSPRDRAQQLLKGIDSEIAKLIKKKAAKKSKGKTSMTRTWILDQYEKQVKIAKFLDDEIDDKIEEDKHEKPDHSLSVVVGPEDETRTCRTCAARFEFTIGEQQYYVDKKVEKKPENCKTCRDKFKADAKTKPCKDFSAGNCRFGKGCRFMHTGDDVAVIEMDDAAAAVNTEMNDIEQVMAAAGTKFGTKEFSPYAMEGAAVAEMEELAECVEEIMPGDDY